jgi:hypothetical protein
MGGQNEQGDLMTNQSKFCSRRTVLATLLAVAYAAPSVAGEFEFGEGWQGNVSSSVSVGSMWRIADRLPALYGQENGAKIGLTNGTGANTIDEGNLNYAKGDRISTPFKLFSEFEGKKGTQGFLIRGKAWYDEALKNNSVNFGNQGNGYSSSKPMSDSGFEKLSQYSGVYLLDAYVYDTFDGLDKQPLQVRVGNQVVNWGESLFVQGINTINPIDVPAYRKPGAQLKEVFLPVPIVHGSQSLGEKGTVEAFVQTNWRNTPVEASCGNYWAVAGANISTNPGACNNAVTLTGNSATGVAYNAYVPQVEGKKAKNSGEFGLAYRFTIDSLDTEFGTYFTNLHSRLPVISVLNKVAGPGGAGGNASPIASLWEYPEDIKTFGLSAATNINGWSMGAEVSKSFDVPAQVDGNDLLNSSLLATGINPNVPRGTPVTRFGPAAVAALNGDGYLKGYRLANKTQFQVNGVKVGRDVLGADQYLFVAEAAYQTNNLPDYKSDPNALRFGRPFIFGSDVGCASGGPAATSANCANDGYVSKNAWGYRLKAELTYNGLIPGVTVYPGLYFSHDVKGYSIDSQFIEKRMALSPTVRFSMDKKYTLELGAVYYNRNATYDPLRDRGFAYINAGMSF